ncbi:DUF262 domain-containing protein [Neobacillus sp. SCS-31]|uniref:DUF262 domain-containing protein n=1 Tax=Neobacillus oceani TaxID=3115292 RepID=UPI0039064228
MFAINKTTSTILEWYTHFISKNIDFNPPYQRIGGIWSTESKQLLIDSIFNNMDIPKFYVNYFINKGNELNPKEKLFAIIDGKQRFLSIFEFMEDKFPLSQNFEFFDDPEIKINGMNYSEIAIYYPKLKYLFDNFKLDIALVITDEQEKIDELFLRLNEGKQLNNAEKRYAIQGYLSNKLKELIREHNFFIKLTFKDKRYDYFDLLTKLFFLDSNNEILSLNKKNLDALLKENRQPTEEIARKLEIFKLNLQDFSNVFNSSDPLLNSKSKIPIYYVLFKTLESRNWEDLHTFLSRFENLIMKNRISNGLKDETLIEYDRLTQQGTISKSSIENRLRILNLYFNYFIENGGSLNIISIPIDIEE